MKEVKIGLIGLGFMGVAHGRIYESLPQVKVVALADPVFAGRHGDADLAEASIDSEKIRHFDMNEVKIYEDGLEMISDTDADIIDICAPTSEHCKYLLAALKAGKHVFCEKPLCRNLEQLAEIREAVGRSDRFFNTGLCIRAWPEYDTSKQLIESGALGAVKTAHFRRFSPSADRNWFMKEELAGGAALDLHLHDTDFVCYLFGRPRAVTSFGIRGVVSDNGIDHIITMYDFGDGKMVTAEGGWCAPKSVPFEMNFQIVCEKATLKLDDSGFHLYWNDGRIEVPDTGDVSLPTGLHRELKYFTECVQKNVAPTRWQTPESVFDSMTVVFTEMDAVDKHGKVIVQY